MRLIKTILPIMAIVLMVACKKEKTGSTQQVTNPDTCAESAASTSVIPGQYILAFNEASVHARTMSVQSLLQTSSNILQRNDIDPSSLKGTFSGEPGGFVAALSDDELARLRKDASIKLIEPDRVIKLGSCFTLASPVQLTWNIRRVGYGDGRGKTAWIIDTGIEFDHPDLDVDQTRSRSFIDGKTAEDENGHGTHVSGVIAALNNDIGVLGVASGATLVSLRVLDKDGTGVESAIIQALGYINTNAAAGDVVNMSLGLDTTSTILDQQIENTAAHGIFFAIAAGNDHTLANKTSPARANGPNIYTVSAVDSLDRFASFSNYGNDVVDFAAPGVHILSTYLGKQYAYMSGTSMATPHVAGLLLLNGGVINSSGAAIGDPDGTPDPIAHK